jgi:hypothetical protein
MQIMYQNQLLNVPQWKLKSKHFTQIADNYSLVFVIFINFFGQLKDLVGQVLFLVTCSCPKGQVKNMLM